MDELNQESVQDKKIIFAENITSEEVKLIVASLKRMQKTMSSDSEIGAIYTESINRLIEKFGKYVIK